MTMTWEAAETLVDLGACRAQEIHEDWEDEPYGGSSSGTVQAFRPYLAKLNTAGLITYAVSVGGLGERWAMHAAFSALATRFDVARIRQLTLNDEQLQGLRMIAHPPKRRWFHMREKGVPMGEIHGTPAMIMGTQLAPHEVEELFPLATNPSALAAAKSARQVTVWDTHIGRNDGIKRLIEIIVSRSDIPANDSYWVLDGLTPEQRAKAQRRT